MVAWLRWQSACPGSRRSRVRVSSKHAARTETMEKKVTQRRQDKLFLMLYSHSLISTKFVSTKFVLFFDQEAPVLLIPDSRLQQMNTIN
ncbi:hypothetical protein OUZ56_033354 [Daphnia magna]|uniref:Uncharacterized protein n=1 Tax=Daphnia magna TaxID=35525 RepID=A0ABQ9ZXP6_9CRUS|nr:hypothetical protein OUZ56_033354 [Daphnia magna]